MGKTIEQLEGKAWGEPEYDSYLVTTCHRLRKKPINLFTVEDLRIMIGQDIGTRYLVPSAMEVLEKDPFAEGDFYPGDLLKAMVTLPREYWKEHPKQHLRILAISSKVLDRLRETLAWISTEADSPNI